ncbi:SlyX family protein [Planctomycetes bacterium K23_9]|uniref:t-SNARE coiled-coil homology domain-containing protein n=1 Tax=Stieleria marina TaxID=1930275 RepID=A0A517NWB5_9BACT|nr:hypothetical protein K239x_34110 [Planctomycetes bacterium K23_9]
MSDNTDKRVTELEMQLAHLQRMFDQLNDVVTDQSMRLDKIALEQKKLREKVQNSQTGSDGPVDPLDEKPPHY